MELDIEGLNSRKATLERARIFLKEEFIGIDRIIDGLIEYIHVWYLAPDLLTRPIILNLWGMTGVGKTDLIRKLVKFLGYQERFAEIELSNIDGTNWISSVTQMLEQQELNDGKPAIILFDEIQRFNTLDDEGKPLPQTKFTDFWELLSDGKLAKKSKDELDFHMASFMANAKDIKKRQLRGDEGVDEDPIVDIYRAQQMKKALRLDSELNEVAMMTERDMLALIMNARSKKVIFEPVDHARSLIIVSGNLDEAFDMATQTAEADVDADIFHAFTEKITDVDIKNALSKKFRPEQVARFGNMHLIYTSLKKCDFEALIAREIRRIERRTLDKFGIKLIVDDSIASLIYRNGVFPVQGVRPVFSTIIDILETHLANLVLTAIIEKAADIHIQSDMAASKVIANVGGRTVEISYIGRIDKIRASNQAQTVASISVHECGHAVAYMVLFGLVPLQLKSKVASSYAAGFTFPHEIHMTKQSLIDTIKVYLAGGLAEELIFGKPGASIGRADDWSRATGLAIDFIRKYGFDDEFKANYTLENAYEMDKFETDVDVEKMVSRLEAETKEILNQHRALLLDLSKKLSATGDLLPAAVQDVARLHGVSAQIEHEGFLHIRGYDAIMNEA
ncbi:MAG: AAA family ATPase [Sphingorhabdus sp.]|nr:AAA family ATPase [Sphingorhabdus sp.]